jgi:hypothetical protein
MHQLRPHLHAVPTDAPLVTCIFAIGGGLFGMFGGLVNGAGEEPPSAAFPRGPAAEQEPAGDTASKTPSKAAGLFDRLS